MNLSRGMKRPPLPGASPVPAASSDPSEPWALPRAERCQRRVLRRSTGSSDAEAEMMGGGVIHPPRREARAFGRWAAVIAATTGLVLAAAGCGGNPASPGSRASSTASAVAYSACMRSHGVANYADPNSSGQLPKGGAQAFGVSTSRYQAAQQACRHRLPNSDTTFAASLDQCLMTGNCPPAVVQRALTEGRKFAQCMRNQGVPNWPDPTIDSMGRPSFQVTAAGISLSSTRSPQMLSKIGHCQSQTGAVLLREE